MEAYSDKLFLCTIIATLSYALYCLILNRRRHSSIPGPFFAGLTDLWQFFYQWNDHSWVDVCRDLHKRYGNVVRYGPNKLSFSDPAAVGVIFATNPPFEKVDRPLHSANETMLTPLSQMVNVFRPSQHCVLSPDTLPSRSQ